MSGEMPISGHGEHLAMFLTAERQGFHRALATFIPDLSTSESQLPITITLRISRRVSSDTNKPYRETAEGPPKLSGLPE